MLRSIAGSVLALVLAPPVATADLVNFSYSWSVSTDYSQPPLQVSPDGSTLNMRQGAGAAVLTLGPSGEASATPGGSWAVVPAGSLAVTSPFTSSVQQGFEYESLAYLRISLNITDLASGASGELSTFFGAYTDSTPGRVTLIANANAGDSAMIGGHLYSVSMNLEDFLGPGSAPVQFSAIVSVDAHPTPEPGACTLVLVGGILSLGGLAGRGRRNRR